MFSMIHCGSVIIVCCPALARKKRTEKGLVYCDVIFGTKRFTMYTLIVVSMHSIIRDVTCFMLFCPVVSVCTIPTYRVYQLYDDT